MLLYVIIPPILDIQVQLSQFWPVCVGERRRAPGVGWDYPGAEGVAGGLPAAHQGHALRSHAAAEVERNGWKMVRKHAARHGKASVYHCNLIGMYCRCGSIRFYMFLGGFTDSLCLWLASGSRKLSDPHRDPHRRGSRDETDKDTQKAVAQLRWGEFLPEFLGNLKVVGNPMTMMMMMMMNDNDDNRNNDNSLEREREREGERERGKKQVIMMIITVISI